MNAFTRLIEQHNLFHLPTIGEPQSDWYKEWYHFCILAPGIDAILNLNLSGDSRPSAAPEAQIARVVLLLHEDNWDGDVDTIPFRDTQIESGLINVRFGHNSVRFDETGFSLSIALQNRPITLTLRLEPATIPLLMRSNTMIGQGKINWLVVPRLVANGSITVADRIHKVKAAPAYHDHNWGRWLWGHDLAWEWGFVLPDDQTVPWSLVFDRTTNRARSKVLELTLALWQEGNLQRVFTQDEVHVRPSDFVRLEQITKFPRVMTLIAPENTAEIPRYLEIDAKVKQDWLQAQFAVENVAQIVIPNETNMGNTIINEVIGQMSVKGRIKSQEIAFRGRSIFEFLT